MKKNEFKVNLDKDNNTLTVEVKVDLKGPASEVTYYDMSRVLNELKNRGYNVSERQCFDKSAPVRSDNGKENTSGTWRFKLSNEKATKPAAAAAEKKPTIKKTPKKTTKKTTRQTTQSVLKSYNKG